MGTNFNFELSGGKSLLKTKDTKREEENRVIKGGGKKGDIIELESRKKRKFSNAHKI